jgi:hypothetical protein
MSITDALASAGNASAAWATKVKDLGALAVTAAVVALYATFPADDTLKNILIMVVSYWVGSSNSSSKKDDTIATSTAALAVSVPVVPADPPKP